MSTASPTLEAFMAQAIAKMRGPTEIVTDEGMDEVFRAAGHLLTYQGIDLRRHEVRDLYLRILKSQRQESAEDHPEFDAVAIWQTIISEF